MNKLFKSILILIKTILAIWSVILIKLINNLLLKIIKNLNQEKKIRKIFMEKLIKIKNGIILIDLGKKLKWESWLLILISNTLIIKKHFKTLNPEDYQNKCSLVPLINKWKSNNLIYLNIVIIQRCQPFIRPKTLY